MNVLDKTALYSLSYGLYIVCGKQGDKINGQIANTAFQISGDPITVAVSINKNNLTHEYIMSDQLFTISVLASDAPISLIGNFGFKTGRDGDKFSDLEYELSPQGVPYIPTQTLSYIEAEVLQAVDAGTHTIFIGKATDAKVFRKDEPMTYALYHKIKSGGAKPAEPQKEAPVSEEPLADDSYKCMVCGYIYYPGEGDLGNNIKPGTSFEDLPEDWVCPVCGVGKDQFEKN